MLVGICHQHLKALGEVTGETAHLGVREGREVLFVDHCASIKQIVVPAHRGADAAVLHRSRQGAAVRLRSPRNCGRCSGRRRSSASRTRRSPRWRSSRRPAPRSASTATPPTKPSIGKVQLPGGAHPRPGRQNDSGDRHLGAGVAVPQVARAGLRGARPPRRDADQRGPAGRVSLTARCRHGHRTRRRAVDGKYDYEPGAADQGLSRAVDAGGAVIADRRAFLEAAGGAALAAVGTRSAGAGTAAGATPARRPGGAREGAWGDRRAQPSGQRRLGVVGHRAAIEAPDPRAIGYYFDPRHAVVEGRRRGSPPRAWSCRG